MQITWLLLLAIIFAYLERRSRRTGEPFPWVYCFFFFSGFPALIYQIVWERALFASYGVNVESVAVVVTAFMLGLGLGSIAGGRISRSPRVSFLACFGIAELSTAVFGIFSLRLFHQVAHYTAGTSLFDTALLSISLLLVPTMYYNTTGSEEVLLTGTTVFPYGLRVGNFLAVSDRPFVLDAQRLRKRLLEYRIDDRAVLDPAVPDDARRLEEMIALTHHFAASDANQPTIETTDSIRTRCHDKRIITDDNMGTEWGG